MAPAHSKLNNASQVADCLIYHMASNPPPIKFMRSKCASKAPADTMYHEFKYPLDATDKKSLKMSKKTQSLRMATQKCGAIGKSNSRI
jgi:hypothetical protein